MLLFGLSSYYLSLWLLLSVHVFLFAKWLNYLILGWYFYYYYVTFWSLPTSFLVILQSIQHGHSIDIDWDRDMNITWKWIRSMKISNYFLCIYAEFVFVFKIILLSSWKETMNLSTGRGSLMLHVKPRIKLSNSLHK